MPKKLFLMVVWPYIYRWIARHVAGFLQTRRDRRMYGEPEEVPDSVSPHRPPCPKVEEKQSDTAPKIWYTLAGVVLGSALSAAAFFAKERFQTSP